jgi:hypothetical protein
VIVRRSIESQANDKSKKAKITNGGKDEENNKAAVAAAQLFDVKHFLNHAMVALSDFMEVVKS